MIYLIGGPARCGKSTLANRVRREMDSQMISGDLLLEALRGTTKREWLPDIFHRHSGATYHGGEPKQMVERLRRRDKVLWSFIRAYLQAASQKASHDSIVAEGGIWPDFIQSLELPHRAVFLVDTSSDEADRLISIRDSNSDNNWMVAYSDKDLAEWAVFNAERSRHFVMLCEEFGYRYFDVAYLGIKGASDAAFEYLTKKEV